MKYTLKDMKEWAKTRAEIERMRELQRCNETNKWED